MMNIRQFAFASLVAMAPVAAVAGAFSIKDYTLGMTLEAYRFNYMCNKRGDESVCIDGAPNDTIAGHPMRSTFLIFGDSGVAKQISIKIPSSGYDDIKKAITAKYGKPKCTKEDVQTRFGAKFQNEFCVLEKDEEVLAFKRYESDIEFGVVLLTTKKILENVMKAEAKKTDDI